MKKLLTLFITSGLVCGLSAHEASKNSPVAPTKTEATSATSMQADNAVALGLLAAINQHEIDAAKQAKSKKVSAPALKFANKMQTEHGDNLAKTKTLGSLSNNAEVQAEKAKGQKELAELAKKSGKAYEAAYIDAMVKGHSDVLAKIDTKLLPMASSIAVKQHLTQTRHHVAMHLEAAKTLQSSR